MHTKILTYERAHELFYYNPETGFIHRKIYRSPNAKAGDRAGSKTHGYLEIAYNNRSYMVHRVIWLMIYGDWPEQIDHINHDRSDNRIENLRSVTPLENKRNNTKQKNNGSGLSGVRWDATRGKWEAYIHVHKKKIFLGRYSSLLDAVCSRKAAENLYGFHPNNGR